MSYYSQHSEKYKGDNAVVFVHGFIGNPINTWSGFPKLLAEDPDLGMYDFYFWGYPSELNPKSLLTKYFWEDDPSVVTIGRGLRTLLSNKMTKYKKLVLVGHSMGGLVIQAFILEEIGRQLREHLDRISEVIFYATPSGGKQEARWGSFLKNQLADMSDLGPFIKKLRQGWEHWIHNRRGDPLSLPAFG